MTLKSLTQLTNVGWMIGGVSAITGGYSYYSSNKEKVSLVYSQKKLEKISSISDIEDLEAEKGCKFVFFTKKATIEGNLLKNQVVDYTVARHNEWIDGGVLSARDYADKNKNDKVDDKVIKLANDAKDKCTNGQIIYREVDKTPKEPAPVVKR